MVAQDTVQQAWHRKASRRSVMLVHQTDTYICSF